MALGGASFSNPLFTSSIWFLAKNTEIFFLFSLQRAASVSYQQRAFIMYDYIGSTLIYRIDSG